ncbi:hypothetical protein FRC12_010797 [Ceratobasidium sp. 428]|nr:hypothetical protein FRC12_010797 [Ceratobasidium sp. 428]
MMHTLSLPAIIPQQLFARDMIRYAPPAVALIIAAIALYLKSRTRASPPTISGHWFFKNQHLIGNPWRSMLMAEKYKSLYGDIIQLSTPFKTVVVLSSSQAITEVLEKQSVASASRPRNVMLLEMTNLVEAITFRNHDEWHKKCRRVMASALHPTAALSYTELHTATSAFFLRGIMNRLKDHDIEKEPNRSVLLLASVQDAIGRFIIRMTYGRVVVENDPMLAMIKRQAEFVLFGFAKHFWVNDFPILRYVPAWFPGAGFKREALYRRKQRILVASEPFAPILKDVSQGTVERPSYSSKLLESKGGIDASEEDVELVKWTAQAMFAAGSTTTTALVHSFLFAMCIYPDVAIEVQAELDAQVGRDRLPNLNDRQALPYMNAVLQEVFRCFPVFPLCLPHCAAEDIEIRGYKIKKGTTIEGNIWAVMHEPEMYPDPHRFDPSRFLKQTPDPDPRRYIFGFGRRLCPGLHVGENGVFTMCAAFISVFNIAAGDETMREVEKCGQEVWRMFTPYGPFFDSASRGLSDAVLNPEIRLR